MAERRAAGLAGAAIAVLVLLAGCAPGVDDATAAPLVRFGELVIEHRVATLLGEPDEFPGADGPVRWSSEARDAEESLLARIDASGVAAAYRAEARDGFAVDLTLRRATREGASVVVEADERVRLTPAPGGVAEEWSETRRLTFTPTAEGDWLLTGIELVASDGVLPPPIEAGGV